MAVFETITVNNDVLPAGEPTLGGLACLVPNACLARRLQIVMKSRRSTSAVSVFLGFARTDLTIHSAAVPQFAGAEGSSRKRIPPSTRARPIIVTLAAPNVHRSPNWTTNGRVTSGDANCPRNSMLVNQPSARPRSPSGTEAAVHVLNAGNCRPNLTPTTVNPKAIPLYVPASATTAYPTLITPKCSATTPTIPI